ncbi:hypothetical protein I5466_02825 [Citrobacter koseri]|uniref:hypothetical protein n=1 Tax=Citrobacter koseri TaxID=545 RepID=UPI00190651CE|nr:hypothetical protein [Citrobacter koseri]MBJ9119742.1 hypothetical protein [Citrobacter koseri]MBJ9243880.1 hypothetical protein [Citrobacter koseri]
MAKEKLEVPFEGNDQYYEGIRGLMISSICSVLGVILYAVLLGKLTWSNLSLDTMIALLGWAFVCFVIWGVSFKRTNRVLISFADPTPRPKVAGIFLILLYIVIGTFCALLFDALTMLDNPLTTVDDFWKTFKAFLVTAGCLFVFLFAFGNYAVNKVSPLKDSE